MSDTFDPSIGKDTQFKPGESGNPAGKPKGTKHLSTLIREIGENIDWSKTTLKNREQMQQLYGNNGWKAIVYVAMTKAMAGDAQAMKWLAENGFGKNIDITTNGNDLPTNATGINELKEIAETLKRAINGSSTADSQEPS